MRGQAGEQVISLQGPVPGPVVGVAQVVGVSPHAESGTNRRASPDTAASAALKLALSKSVNNGIKELLK